MFIRKQVEQRINELRDRLFEIIVSEEQKEKKRIKKSEESLRDMRHQQKDQYTHYRNP